MEKRQFEGREIRQYYSTMKHFYEVFDEKARSMPAPTDSVENFSAWQKTAREKFQQILGLDKIPRCPLNPQFISRTEMEDYILERISIESAPFSIIPLTILIPRDIKEGEKRPVWLQAFGHGSPFKMVDSFLPQKDTGRPAFPQPVIGSGGMKELAKRGYITISFDSFGSGERYSFPWVTGEVKDIGSDNPLNNVLTSLGLCKVGMEVWDFMRVCDYALSRNDCDGRIGVAGTSGGGHQSFFFAAADERVTAIATSVWFYGFKDALIGLPHNCSCNFVPGLFRFFECCDLGSLVAPRSFHVETGWRDYLSSRQIGLGNVIEQFNIVKESYKLLQAEDKISLYVFDGGHGCNPFECLLPEAPKSGGGFYGFVETQMPLSNPCKNGGF